MIKILLAEDHSIVREGLKQLIALEPDISVTDDVVDGKKLIDRLRHDGFDMILLDMSMPGISGVSLIKRIHDYSPELPVLVLSMHNDPQIARRALNAGARGYLTKESEPDVLLAAIRKVARGKRFIDPVLAEQMVFQPGEDGAKGIHEILSEREFEIFLLIAKGTRLNEIAEKLSISNKTVSTHKMRLMRKMKFSSNADLVRYAVAHEFVI